MTGPAGLPPPGGHADDLLSAHLDDELDPVSEAWVADHLGECEQCRSAAVALTEARAAIRSLPEVDARPLVEGLLARHRRLIRTGAGFVGVAAAVLGALALTAAVNHPRVVPDVEGMAAAHVAAAHQELADMRPVDGASDGYAAPAGLIGSSVQLSRQAVFDGSDLTVVVYRDEGVVVSVFEQPGALEWKDLPPGVHRMLGDRRVWMAEGTLTMVVSELGDLVVTVVSEHRGAALTALSGLPERHRRSTWDRLHDASQRFTEVFALGAG